MILDLESGDVKFKCYCGVIVDGEPRDVEIDNQIFSSKKQYDMSHIAKIAPFDVTEKVARTCPKCKLTYMSRSVIGEDLQIIYSCKCGYYDLA
jgi:predicted RNA-binding Zn-ribbon protein involved in translation (DUF1610 family)